MIVNSDCCKLDIFPHIFPKTFFDRMKEIAATNEPLNSTIQRWMNIPVLWDLDAQAAATFILGHDVDGREAEAAIRREVDARRLIRPTTIERIDLLPADASLRGLDVAFRDLDKKKRLARLTEEIRRGLARPDVRERYLKIGTPPTYRGPAEFAEFAKADVASWLPIIKASGAVIE